MRIMAKVTMASEASCQLLVVLGQAPPSVANCEPADRPLHHPAARLHDEAGAASDVADDDQRQAEQEAGEQGGEAVVDAVREAHAITEEALADKSPST
jgi:hypothetical protein